MNSSTSLKISPPIISNGGSTDAEEANKNVDSTPADGASLTFINYDAADINPFFHKDAMYLTQGTYSYPSNTTTNYMQETTPNGFQLTYGCWDTGFNNNVYWKWLIKFGITMVQPEMAGVLLFSQTP